MISCIRTPHLPEGKVRHIIIGEKYRNQLENTLFQHNLLPIWLKDNKFVDEKLSGHTDLSAIHTGNNQLVIAEYTKTCEIVDELKCLGFEVYFVDNPANNKYPFDAALNLCIIEDKLIYNPKTANRDLVSLLNCKTKITINQGYTKCSVCIVDTESIITSDKAIAASAESVGMNVLYIKEPFVKLDGYDYGFIGGASFKLSAEEIAFTGVINNSEIKTSIEEFLYKRNVKPVYLTEHEIFDIGSAIPLTEEICATRHTNN